LALGFLLLVSLAVSTFLSLVSGWAGNYLPVEKFAWLINQAVSFGFCVALFVALMRMSTGPKPALRYLMMGAAAGALLFEVGKYLMAFYLSTAAVVSAYGAAGSLVVILMWIYFSSAVLLLAASVARAWSDEAAASAEGRSLSTEVPQVAVTT
jgi:membrane protein